MCIWADYVHSFQYGERWLAVWVVFWVHLVGTWTSCGVFKLAEYMGFWQKYRLPRDRPDMDPNLPQNRKRDRWAIFEQVLGTVLFVPMFIYVVFPYMQLAGVEIATEIPGIRKLSLDIVIMILGCDTLFYWIHRGFHHPLLYRFHKKHHEYKATNVWASEYFDPLDLVANILPGVLPGVLIKTHFITLMAFTLIRSWQSIQAHSGYDLPFDPFQRGPFWKAASRHDFHHSHNMGCYGDFTNFWDYVCGTDVHYKKYLEQCRLARKKDD